MISQHQRIKHIAIFASGAGSNAQKIIDHFKDRQLIKVSLIVTNNPSAGVIDIAKKENIPFLIIEKKRFTVDGYIDELRTYKTDLVVLAGFLWKIPPILIKAFPNRIINIHPALLPKFGGKNMYGHNVHLAVLDSGDKESGITVHYVDELYDHGKIIFQAKCPVEDGETVESLVNKIHSLEHRHYPEVIERVLQVQ